jgi:hypothetical protein
MKRPNYRQEKKRREEAKRKKNEEKRQRKGEAPWQKMPGPAYCLETGQG